MATQKIRVSTKGGTKIHETSLTNSQIMVARALNIDLQTYKKALVEMEYEKIMMPKPSELKENNEVDVNEDDGTFVDTYGGAVCENYMLKLQTLHKNNKIPRYIVEISFYGERLIRKMARVETFDGWRYADIITGSLYNPKTGMCNSAEARIIKVRKDIPVAKKKAVKKVAKKAVKKAVKKTTKAKK